VQSTTFSKAKVEAAVLMPEQVDVKLGEEWLEHFPLMLIHNLRVGKS
jgi:hypothetical protein